MTRDEFINLTKAIKTFYPRDNMLPNMEAMELWYRELSDIPYAIAEAALRKYVSTNKFSPTIADIREMAATVSNGDKPLWSDGWEQVQTNIRKYGMCTYDPDKLEECMNSFDPLTKKVVDRLGWKNLCQSKESDVMADRANFRMIFEQIVDRDHKSDQLSIGLKQLISGLQERKEIESGERKRLSVANPET